MLFMFSMIKLVFSGRYMPSFSLRMYSSLFSIILTLTINMDALKQEIKKLKEQVSRISLQVDTLLDEADGAGSTSCRCENCLCDISEEVNIPIAIIIRKDEEQTWCQSCWDDLKECMKEEGWTNECDEDEKPDFYKLYSSPCGSCGTRMMPCPCRTR